MLTDTWSIYLTKLDTAACNWHILYIHTVISARRIRQRKYQKRFKLTILREPPSKPGAEPILVVTLLEPHHSTYVIFRDKIWCTTAQIEYNMTVRNSVRASKGLYSRYVNSKYKKLLCANKV